MWTGIHPVAGIATGSRLLLLGFNAAILLAAGIRWLDAITFPANGELREWSLAISQWLAVYFMDSATAKIHFGASADRQKTFTLVEFRL